MMTAGQYRELGSHYELSAEQASDHFARHQLQTLAESYFVLARSMSVLERSTKVFDRISERRKE
jgi:hypothetical protein